MRQRSYKLLYLVFVCAVALTVSSCATNDEKKELKKASLIDILSVLAEKRVWKTKIGKGQDKRYSNFRPAVGPERIYSSDVRGRVYAVDRKTGKRVWRVKLKKALASSVTLQGDTLYLGTYDGELIALDANNGDVKWLAQCSSELLSLPAASSSVVVAQSIDGRVYGFDTKDGKQLWRYDHTVPSLTLRGAADPVIGRNSVYVAFSNGQLVSLSLDAGVLEWSRRVSQPKGRTELEKMVDVDGTPVLDSSIIYAATYQGAIVAISKSKGQLLWRQDVSTANQIALSNGKLFVVDENSHVIAFNADTGVVEWRNDEMEKRGIASPVVIDDYVLGIDEDGHLHVISQEDGRYLHRFKASSNAVRSPVLPYEDGILVLSNKGRLSHYTFKKRNKPRRINAPKEETTVGIIRAGKIRIN